MSARRPGLRFQADMYAIDKHLPGVIADIDFIHFHYPASLNEMKTQCEVLIDQVGGMGYNNETLSLGRLREVIEVPRIQISPHSRIHVMCGDHQIGLFRYKAGGSYILNVRG